MRSVPSIGRCRTAAGPPDHATGRVSRRSRRSSALSETTATVLVRRGLGDPVEARAFLDAEDPRHDPLTLGDMAAAVERIRAAVAGGERICVHGDYDVDGISATAVCVLVLRELGADVEWRLPSRFDEGYGLALETIEQLAADGVDLVVTVDCGITAVAEVARARELGLDVIVTDHHRPAETLPDCPVVATRPSAYPCPDLCGTGVVHTLARALLGDEHPAIARRSTSSRSRRSRTSSRSSTRTARSPRGLRALARTRRPGLQALMKAARVDPATVDATAVGFRLAPRINAAGRLGRPDVALELLLTDDADEAERLAAQLEELNRERQSVEERILREAVALVESWTPEERARRGYVLWDETWHEGVNGIVASRLVERFNRPVVLIARSATAGRARGARSPRSTSTAASAPAPSTSSASAGTAPRPGCRSRPSSSRRSARRSPRTPTPPRPMPTCARDRDRRDRAGPAAHARAGEELDRLAPFGLGNPEPTLLVASVEAVSASTVGEGKHLRFRIRQHERDGGSAIAFGLGRQLDRLQRPGRYDVAFRLKENRWNGTVAPQLVVRRVFDAALAYDELRAWLAGAVAGRRGRMDARRPRDLRGARPRRETARARQLLESERSAPCSSSADVELPEAA